MCAGIVPPAAAVGVKEPVECDGVAEDDEVFVDCPEAAQEGQMVLQGGTIVQCFADIIQMAKLMCLVWEKLCLSWVSHVCMFLFYTQPKV